MWTASISSNWGIFFYVPYCSQNPLLKAFNVKTKYQNKIKNYNLKNIVGIERNNISNKNF